VTTEPPKQRWFNTAGPCKPDIHYLLPSTQRLPEVLTLIEQQAYFVIHAPRQIGKTTLLWELAHGLTSAGRFAAVVLSCEAGAAYNHDPDKAERTLVERWSQAVEVRLPPELRPPPPADRPGARVAAYLKVWCQTCPRPVVLLLDEIDALQDEALISILRQLRDGYSDRPRGFPWALALAGLRDVRDYKVAGGGSERLNTSSPFNIKARSLTLTNFSRDDVSILLRQHTSFTGQRFLPDALDLVFDLTQGQPWLVNSLAKICVEELVTDRALPVAIEHVRRAKEILIERQETHLDSLAERLRESRVRAIIEPILAGGVLGDLPQDDVRYVLDLGLARLNNGGQTIQIANPIYREIISNVLTLPARISIPASLKPIWLRADGRLDEAVLLDAFLKFWRQHGQPLLATAHYHEVAAQLVMMAFLSRVVNGGGWLEREYAIGSGRIDLCLNRPLDRLAIEMKVWRDGRSDPLAEGLEQIDEYLSGLSLSSGWLVIFDQRSGITPIAERTSASQVTSPSGRRVTVIRA
jgi:hypothetical protein